MELAWLDCSVRVGRHRRREDGEARTQLPTGVARTDRGQTPSYGKPRGGRRRHFGQTLKPPHLTLLLQGTKPSDQIGYHSAFAKMVDTGSLRGYDAFPFRGCVTEADWHAFFASVLNHMKTTGSDALLCQYFHQRMPVDPTPFLEAVRALPQRPIIATSCGDPFGPGVRRIPRSLTRAARQSDLAFSTSMGGLADALHRAGCPRLMLLPNGACDERFGSTPPPPADVDRDFDVVFIGSNKVGRNPLGAWGQAGRARRKYVDALTRRFGTRFGLFGHGWRELPSWQGPVPFDEQVTTVQRSQVVFGGYPASSIDYYTSDRTFIQAIAGVPLIDHWVPRVESLLEPGREWVLVRTPEELVARVEALLELGQWELEQIGQAGREAIQERHMQSQRAQLMVRTISELQQAARSGRQPRRPNLDFFHESVNMDAEVSTAFRGW